MVGVMDKMKRKSKKGKILEVKDGKITEKTENPPDTQVKKAEPAVSAVEKRPKQNQVNFTEDPPVTQVKKAERVKFAVPAESPDPVVPSPTVEHDGEFEWPTLFEEMDENLETCLFMYPLVELRALVANGKLPDPHGNIMRSPKSSQDMFDVVMSNAKTIDSQDCNYIRGILSAVGDRVKRPVGKSSDQHKTDGTVEVFYDGLEGAKDGLKPAMEVSEKVNTGESMASSTGEGLSYSILAYHARKRITLTLRGKVLNDFSWASATMKTVANPMAKHPGQKETLRLHSTFYDCLFKPSSRQAQGPNGEVLTEYHDILLQVINVMKKYPGYKLYVTGWSFGAALANLFAAIAAAELDSVLPKPVTCVSYASPLVGDNHFRDLHQLLECQGKLRHLRVYNHKDLLAVSPSVSACDSNMVYHLVFDEGTGAGIPFKHAGMGVKLHGANDPFEISFPKKDNGTVVGNVQTFTNEVKLAWENSYFSNLSWTRSEYSKYHNIWTYSKRMAKGAALLEYMYLNDLYEEKGIVGDDFARKVASREIDS